MKATTILSASALLLFASAIAACSSSSAGPSSPPNAPPTASGDSDSADAGAGDGGSTDAGPGTPSGDSATDTSGLTSACHAQFDAMLARYARCPGVSPVKLAIGEVDRDNFVADCVGRGQNPGTGYTAAFRSACAQALKDAACSDVDRVVKACWEPRGALKNGTNCAMDDQCANGYCALPDGGTKGSSCGTCGTPVWVSDLGKCAAQYDKCEPGLVCAYDGDNTLPSCAPFDQAGVQEGAFCDVASICGDGLSCVYQQCVKMQVVRVGEKCDGTTSTCEAGATCVAKAGTCMKNGMLGDACDPLTQKAPNCRDWLVCSGTHRCERRELLQCN